jgi:L-lactate utilization protein LutC
MDGNLHLRSSEKGRFKVTKFLNITTKLIHQMWDKMVTMIVIEKDNRMETISEVVQTYVEGSFMIRTPMEGDDYGGEKGKDD